MRRGICDLRVAVGLVALAAMMLGGCSDGNPFHTQPISGKITYVDGQPIDAPIVFVHFVPDPSTKVGDKYPQPAQTLLSADGTFAEVSTFSRSDGAILGQHKVVIEAMNGDYTPKPAAVAQSYSDPAQTPLSINVGSSERNHFELIVRRSQ